MTTTEHEAPVADDDTTDTPSTDVAVAEHQRPLSGEELERIAHLSAALDGIPLVPNREEVRQLAAIAVTATAAGNVPKAIRGKPNDAFMVLLEGRTLGLAPTTALRMLHVIDGTVTVPPKVKLARIRQLQLGDVFPHAAPRTLPDGTVVVCECGSDSPANDDRVATWHAIRGHRFTSSTWTWVDAENAGLAGKDNWKQYPARMLSWRALGYLLDDVFPDVGTGLYAPDELGAVTNEEGEPIDVASWESPPGMTRPQAARPPAPVEMAEEADVVEVQLRSTRLLEVAPEEATELRTWWQGNYSPAKPGRLERRHLAPIRARLKLHEDRVRQELLAQWADDLAALDPRGAPFEQEAEVVTGEVLATAEDRPSCAVCSFVIGPGDASDVTAAGEPRHAQCEEGEG